MHVHVEHVRSFSTRHSIPLRPLTLLLGENSSGKSTFLAVVSSVFDGGQFPGNPPFNVPPYNLGTFDTIATYKGGKYGRDDAFTIGFSQDDQDKRREVTATYGSDYGNVTLRTFRIITDTGTFTLNVTQSKLIGKVTFAKENGKPLESIDFDYGTEDEAFLSRQVLVMPPRFMFHMLMDARQHTSKLTEHQRRSAFQILEAAELPFPGCFSFAPIRSKPRRTYDELSEEYSPEGDHVPTLLAKLLREQPTSQDGRRVQQALLRFGEESGLFRKVDDFLTGQNLPY